MSDDVGLGDLVTRHDTQITLLTERMTSVDSKIDGLGSKLDRVANALAARPSFDVRDLFSYVRDGAVILGLAVSAIVYVASGHYSADIVLMKDKITRIERIIDTRTINSQ